MNCFVSEGTIYDRRGNQILPDEKGIVVVEVGDKPRRFVKDKLIDWLARSNQLIPPPKIKGKTTIESPKVAASKVTGERKAKTWTRRKMEWKKRTDFTRKGFEITAKKDGIEYGPFISLAKCAAAVKVSKSQISKILRGEATTTTGFEFFKK